MKSGYLQKIKKFLKPDVTLLPFKGYYLTREGAHACILPFMPIFATELGLTVKEIAIIFGIFPVLIIFTNPIIGAIADKFRKHRNILLLVALIEIITTLPIYYIPPLFQVIKTNVFCNETGLYFNRYINDNKSCWDRDMNSPNLKTCNLSCDIKFLTNSSGFLQTFDLPFKDQNMQSLPNATILLNYTVDVPPSTILNPRTNLHIIEVNDHSTNAFHCYKEFDVECSNHYRTVEEESKFSWTYQFWIFFFLKVGEELANAGGCSVGDAVTLQKLKDRPALYGRQRLMGSIGYGVMCSIFGKVNDLYSDYKGQSDFGIGFYGFAVIMAITFFIIFFFMKIDVAPKSHSLLKDVRKIVTKPEVGVFMFMVFVSGMFHKILFAYLFIYMKSLHATKTNLGVAILIECLGELPFFFFSGFIIRKLGHTLTMCVVFIGWGIRIGSYTYIPDPWLFLLVEWLHGVTFGLFYANMAAYAKHIAPPGTLATTQEIFGALWQGIGGGLGTLFGGLIYDKYGPINTFRGCAVAAFIICIIYFIVMLIIKKYSVTENIEKEKEEANPPEMEISKF